jgi:GTP-binding protein LepA
VFAGLYPVESSEYDQLRESLEKLKLNDASLQYEPEVSQALGFGFRCGFLGMLHMDIVQERLEREFDMDLITTAPTVVYEVLMNSGDDHQRRESGQAAGTVQDRRNPRAHHHRHDLRAAGISSATSSPCATRSAACQVDMRYHGRQVQLVYDMPMNEVVMDFFDRLKSVSRGYASLDYEFKEYRTADLVKLDHAGQQREGRCACR